MSLMATHHSVDGTDTFNTQRGVAIRHRKPAKQNTLTRTIFRQMNMPAGIYSFFDLFTILLCALCTTNFVVFFFCFLFVSLPLLHCPLWYFLRLSFWRLCIFLYHFSCCYCCCCRLGKRICIVAIWFCVKSHIHLHSELFRTTNYPN